MTAVVYTAPAVTVEDLESTLLQAFHALRDAVVAGRPAVAIVRDADVLGHGDPAHAALANALIGLARALALEGARENWAVNVLSVPDDPPANAVAEWIDRLGEPTALSGALVRLGDLHLGRVPA